MMKKGAAILALGALLLAYQNFSFPDVWNRNANNPILIPGQAATQAPTRTVLNIADPSVMYDYDEVDPTSKWKMWFAFAFDDQNQLVPKTGKTTLDNPRVGIGYATSLDGLKWTVKNYSALLPTCYSGGINTDWDFTNVETPVVIKNPNPNAPSSRRFMMWYSMGNNTKDILPGGYPYYQIGLAFSADGKFFQRLPSNESPFIATNIQSLIKPGLVFIANQSMPGSATPVATGVVADPHVVYHDGMFHMWFSNITYRSFPGTLDNVINAGIGYASSADGIYWTASNSNPLPGLKRPGNIMGAQPSVLWNDLTNQYEMWFTSDTDGERSGDGTPGFWKATSLTGIDWTADFNSRDFSGNTNLGSEAYNLITGVNVFKKEDMLFMYYSAFGNTEIPRNLHDAGYDRIWNLNVATKLNSIGTISGSVKLKKNPSTLISKVQITGKFSPTSDMARFDGTRDGIFLVVQDNKGQIIVSEAVRGVSLNADPNFPNKGWKKMQKSFEFKGPIDNGGIQTASINFANSSEWKFKISMKKSQLNVDANSLPLKTLLYLDSQGSRRVIKLQPQCSIRAGTITCN